MFLFRCAFFFYYGRGLDWTNLGNDIIKTFIMGLRLDASVLSVLNIPVTVTLIVMLFLKNEGYFNKILSAIKIYYTAVIGFLFVFLVCDFGFFSYFQDHFNSMVYGLFEDDTKAILLTIVHNYNLPVFFIEFAALFVSVYFFTKFVLNADWQKIKVPANPVIKILLSVLFVCVSFSVMRGSFGDHPLVVNSAVSSNMFLNKIATNGVFTLQSAIESKQKENNQRDYVKYLGYGDDIRRAFADFLNKNLDEISAENPEASLIVKYPHNKTIEELQPNVVIIVMESFGTDLLQYNSPEFDVLGSLKKHFDEDIVFYNFVPAWHSTQESVEGIITNVGIRPGSVSRFNSKYQYVNYPQNGHKPYKEKGYESFFLYSGNLGWRNIGGYMSNSGFDNVISAISTSSSYSSNEWGVYDEYLFDNLFKLLEQGNKKFIYALTTTNHPPYSLPESYKPAKFVYPEELAARIVDKEFAEKRFQTYRYSNDELGKLISKIKNSPYAQNTVIAVTGDHNFKNIYSYSPGDFFNETRVPFYLYIPGRLKPAEADASVFGSYIDILPTVYSLTLSDAQMYVMGKNLLSDEAKDNIVYSPGNNFLADKNLAMYYRLLDSDKSYYFVWDKGSPGKLVRSEKSGKYDYLIRYARSSVAVADYIIKKDYK